MAKKKEEQQMLIDVHPKNEKEILKTARAYKEAQSERISALAEEKKLKQEIIELVKKAKLTPLDDGSIKFTLDGVRISITPRDELVQIKELDK